MTNTLHFSEWRNCIRAQRKVNLCAPGAPKGPKGRMVVRQYEILCANDAGRAPRKYPDMVYHYDNYSWKLICNECDILPIRLWSVLRIRTLPPHTRCKQYIGNIDRSNLSHYDFMYTIIKIRVILQKRVPKP